MEICIPMRDTKRDTSSENTLDLTFYELYSQQYMVGNSCNTSPKV